MSNARDKNVLRRARCRIVDQYDVEFWVNAGLPGAVRMTFMNTNIRSAVFQPGEVCATESFTIEVLQREYLRCLAFCQGSNIYDANHVP